MLFNSLPRRCVVLLEDIDSAGLSRKADEGDEAETVKRRGGKPSITVDAGSLTKEIARAFKSANDRNDRENGTRNKGISLSGLLNAIDGVASHEGRVLIMTTNHPEKLDDALIRPGRVDMQIEFTLAKRDQVKELFVRMYTSDSAKPAKTSCDKRVLLNGRDPHSGLLTLDQIIQLAKEFAGQIPELTFSPAEIQGFLLTRKKDPQNAVDEVAHWMKKTLEARAARKAAAANAEQENCGRT